MKTLKVAVVSLLVISAIVAALIGISIHNLDSIVKSGIEEVGPQVTQTPVSVDNVHISLLDGLGEIKGLTLGNPKGFHSDYAFHLDHVALQIEPESLLDEVYVVNQVTIDGAKIIAEQVAGTTNLQALQKNIEKASGSGAGTKPGAGSGSANEEGKATGSEGNKSEPRLMVEEINIVNNSLTLISENFGQRELKIPDIKMSNLGSRDQGITPEQLADIVIGRITKEAENRAADELKAIAKEKAKGKFTEKIKDKWNSLFGK